MVGALALICLPSPAQQVGSIRGVVYDKDFDAPLPLARVTIVERGDQAESDDQGSYVFSEVPPGKYTLTFAKEGYVRQIRTDVIVSPGQLTDIDIWLTGEFTEMEEFVVRDLQLAAGTEAALLNLRFESPSLLDSISADLMSRAGASDAASALKLVAGASLKDGKSAVIRGLPDRYVSSLINGVRAPSADEDTRAVQLDQFPASVIESIQVSKTFTPDQQGDASGGAVDVRLKGIPDEPFFLKAKAQLSANTQAAFRRDSFLTYDRGGLSFLGIDDGDRDIQDANIGDNWEGAVGVMTGEAPIDYKWSLAAGGRHEFGDGFRIGATASVFYERDSSYHDNGIDDGLWVERPGEPLTPRTTQGTIADDQFKTELFDIVEGTQTVQWGALAAVGLEYEEQSLTIAFLHTRTTDDTATLAEDTRGKEFFFPGHDPDDVTTPGHGNDRQAAPYLRLETLNYIERTTQSLQLHGEHVLPVEDILGQKHLAKISDDFKFLAPELEWTVALSQATQSEPDKRQFGTEFVPRREFNGQVLIPDRQNPFRPSVTINLGNFQRIFERIEEDSTQYSINLKFPFEQWTGDKGYLKLGIFRDEVERTFEQETFSNSGDSVIPEAPSSFEGGFDEFWSEIFPSEFHPIFASDADIDYEGEIEVSAWYAMLDIPIVSSLRLVGGVRIESTDLSVTNDPEEQATYFPPGAPDRVNLEAGDPVADAAIDQKDLLPAVALIYDPIDELTIRASYTQTIARQTFKEITPIIQQEFLGGPIFVGNPTLGLSSVTNYDLRIDYRPYPGGLISASYFRKDLKDPIEFVQRVAASFDYTTPVNYPKGRLEGVELEIRQDLGFFLEELEGLTVGANATFIDSRVRLPDDDARAFRGPNVEVDLTSREMTNAPEYLYNIFLSYDLALTGTQLSLLYSVQGDTLLTGAGVSPINTFVPSIFASEVETLNLSVVQRIGDSFKLQLQAKNITNPKIKRVYRDDSIGDDVTQASFTRGIEFSISFSGEFRF